METIGNLNILNDPYVTWKIVRKLPRNVIVRWTREDDQCLSQVQQVIYWVVKYFRGVLPFLTKFCAFLEKEARIARNPVLLMKDGKQSDDRPRVNQEQIGEETSAIVSQRI